MCADAVMAQPRERFGGWSIGQSLTSDGGNNSIQPPTRNGDFIDNYSDAQGSTNVRTPLAPATLLLLGLSGAAVGATIVRNTKKGGE